LQNIYTYSSPFISKDLWKSPYIIFCNKELNGVQKIQRIFIEHLESELSRWILAEYKNSFKIAGSILMITGVEIEGLPSSRKRFHELIDPSKVIILDPQASQVLTHEDLQRFEAVVIGGILGSHPPLGRTKKLLSDKFPEAEKRNIGRYQFPIDGAVYVVMEMLRGRRLEDIKIALGLVLRRRIGEFEHLIELPYAYPLIDDKPLISDEVIKILVGEEDYELEIINITTPI
jgi:ribosome biogenesis SPOUT family RNA methylase Rps3